MRDHDAVRGLFEDGGVLVARRGEARGSEAIAHAAAGLWGHGYTYLAEPRLVVQARDTALVVGASGISVLRRGDGVWRFAISVLDGADTTKEERS